MEHASTDLVRADKDLVVLRTSPGVRAPGEVGVRYIPSGTHFFMMEVNGMMGQQVNAAMAKHKVIIGRAWQE